MDNFINKILVGDSTKILKNFPDNCIDMIITSPPYNFSMSYDNYNDTKDWTTYLSTLDAIWTECFRILKPGGRIAINVQPLYSEYIPTHHLITTQLKEKGFLWKAEFLWEKNNYNAKYTAWGSWKSPSMPYIKYSWEFIEVFCKETFKKTGNKEDIDITADEFKSWVYGKWSFSSERRMVDFGHPAMFPEELPKRLIKLFSYKHDIILDPFNGAGTTTFVAKQLNRNFIGIDSSPKYCAIAQSRLEKISIHFKEITTEKNTSPQI